MAKNDHDWCYTGTNPLKVDSDGDGIGDYMDDVDGDHLANHAEWKMDPSTGLPVGWTHPRKRDSDSVGIWDGDEVHGNPANKDQTSDPLKADTDNDRLTDDIDPRTWIKDYLPFSRVRGNAANGGPMFPTLVTKGSPFNVEGHVEYNTTDTRTSTGNWRRIASPMEVQIWIEQGGEMIPISDPVITGAYGNFKISCTIGDNVKATSNAKLVITTTIHSAVDYLPVTWDEINGNDLS